MAASGSAAAIVRYCRRQLEEEAWPIGEDKGPEELAKGQRRMEASG